MSDKVKAIYLRFDKLDIFTVFSLSFNDYLKASSLYASLTRYIELLFTKRFKLNGNAAKAVFVER